MVSYNLSPRFFRPWGTLWMFNLIATLFHLPFCSPVPKSCGNPFQNSGGCYSSILIPMVFEWLVKQSHMGLILSFSSVLHLPPCIGLYSRDTMFGFFNFANCKPVNWERHEQKVPGLIQIRDVEVHGHIPFFSILVRIQAVQASSIVLLLTLSPVSVPACTYSTVSSL